MIGSGAKYFTFSTHVSTQYILSCYKLVLSYAADPDIHNVHYPSTLPFARTAYGILYLIVLERYDPGSDNGDCFECIGVS